MITNHSICIPNRGIKLSSRTNIHHERKQLCTSINQMPISVSGLTKHKAAILHLGLKRLITLFCFPFWVRMNEIALAI